MALEPTPKNLSYIRRRLIFGHALSDEQLDLVIKILRDIENKMEELYERDAEDLRLANRTLRLASNKDDDIE